METASEKITMTIQDRHETVYGNEGFAKMLRERLGDDACSYFLSALDNKPCCSGECDTVYSLQETYETLLHDVKDELEAWDIQKLTKAELAKKRYELCGTIEAGI